MANDYFQFKQFRINQKKTAMKVGTDGVLLGACVDPTASANILDVGSGTGLISLMLAQKNPQAHITGLEIDNKAYEESLENVAQSPWNNITILQKDFFEYSPDAKFDLIVSNPPFFSNSQHSGNASRDKARHNIYFDIHAFFSKCKEILTPKGTIAIIYPTDNLHNVLQTITDNNLHIINTVHINPTPNKPPKRIIIEASPFYKKGKAYDLIIEKYGRHKYSEEYIALTKEFYVNL